MKNTAKLTLFVLVALAGTAAALADDQDEKARVLIERLEHGKCPQVVRLGAGGPEILSLGSFGYLGVETTELTPELRRHFGVPEDAGVLLGHVEEGSPAAAAGLEVGDVLTRVDDDDVTSGGRLQRLVRRYDKGDQVTLEYWREGKVATTTAVVGERERCGLDVGQIFDLRNLPGLRLKDLPHVDLEDLPRVDLEDLPHVDLEDLPAFERLLEVRELDGASLEQAAESLQKALESQDWQGYVERLRDVDLSHIEFRLQEALERLHELEEEIRTEKQRIRSDGHDNLF